jgi:hypothetical protein
MESLDEGTRMRELPPQPSPLESESLGSHRTTSSREFQELWFRLSKRDWRSVVLVPADEGGSAAGAATSLAQVGRQLHELPVTLFVMANPDDYWPAMQIVQMAASTEESDALLPPRPLDYAEAVEVSTAALRQNAARPPAGKVIVAIQPVVAEPLGLAVTQAADLVVVHVTMGVTRLSSARRTIDLVGRERIAGCFLDFTSMAG